METASSLSEAIVPQGPTEATPADLAHSLAYETQIDPDLARILSAWPTLPEPIRRAMLALVGSGK